MGLIRSFRNLGRATKAAALLGGIVAVKYPVYKFWKHRQEQRRAVLRSNRLQFGKLPRHKQRAVLYYRRSQVQDLEGIYKRGYRPRGLSLPKKRRGLFS